MDAFSPLPALAGGTLIGVASAVLWLGNGRIAGISGIFGQLSPPAAVTALWRAAFLVALIMGALGASLLLPHLWAGADSGEHIAFVSAPAWTGVSTPIWLAAAGLLIGIGTRIANGCTSGHGVCGLARLSLRSLVAVAAFFGVAILTVAVTRVV